MSSRDTHREFWKVVDATDRHEEEMLIASYDPGLVAVAEHLISGSGELCNADYESVIEAITQQRGWDIESAQEVVDMCFRRVESESLDAQA